jgi:hypothetical protein
MVRFWLEAIMTEAGESRSIMPDATGRVGKHKREILIMIAAQTAIALLAAPCAYFANRIDPIFTAFIGMSFGVTIVIFFVVLVASMERYMMQISLEVTRKCRRAARPDESPNNLVANPAGATPPVVQAITGG